MNGLGEIQVEDVLRMTLILSLILFVYSEVRIITSPGTTGYEENLFSSFPELALTLGLVVLLSTGALLVSGFHEGKYWKHSFCILLLGVSTILLIPLFRGYLLTGSGAADVLNQLGYVRDIQITGRVTNSNWYPVLHIYIYSLSSILGINVSTATQIPQPIFYFVYLVSVGLFVRTTIGGTDAQILGFCAGSVLIIGGDYYFIIRPSIYSWLIIPMVLYTLYNTNNIRFYILSTIFVFLIVFFHPSTTLLLIILVFSTAALYYCIDYEYRPYLINSLLLLISFGSWMTSTFAPDSFYRTLLGLLGVLDRGAPKPGARTIVSAQNRDIIEIGIRFVEIYGPFALLAFGGLVSTILLLYYYYINRIKKIEYQTLVFHYYISVTVSLAILFTSIPFAGSWVRNVRYSMLFSAILVAAGMYVVKHIISNDEIYRILIILFLASTIIIASGLALHSTFNSTTNISKQEYSGSLWAGDHSQRQPVYSYTVRDKILRSHVGTNKFDSIYGKSVFKRIPPRTSIENILKRQDSYFVTQEREISSGIYSEDGIQRAADEGSIDKVYSNGEYSIWSTI